MAVASPAAEKNAGKVRGGLIGARRRWGPQRIVRLDQLDPDTARLIRALLAQRSTDADSTAEAA
jgi:hypothetical protein